MDNLLDFQKLSTFVGGIVDRKIRAISMSITSSTGYLKSLVTQASAAATEAQNHADAAAGSSTDADSAAATSLIVWNNFTSSYIGINASDPSESSIGGQIFKSAFYIRQADGRLRYVINVNAGVPVWADATVAADPASVLSASTGIFLRLNQSLNQTVSGPMTFQSTTLVPRVTSWTSQQAVPAVDLNTLILSLQQNLSNEISRASAAESALATSKVDKSSYSYGSNTNGQWELRPSGVMEQWGDVASSSTGEPTVTVTLPQAMPDVSYSISIVPYVTNANINADSWIQEVKSNKTTTSFQVQYQHPNGDAAALIDGFEWRIIGKYH